MENFIVDQNQVEQIEGMSSSYPYCMHERDLSDIMIPWHWHEELELGYIEKGTSKIITLNNSFEVHQGDGFFINSNVMDMKVNACPGTPVLEINHIFHPVFLGGHFKSIFETKYIAPVTANRSVSVYVIRRGRRTADQ
ncbi:MAG: AraC family ligand binding domain-containing protein, partial [Lachnospiraceae bacterium]|nr:AraC family ligand binding domain-containing protein [Lachnospiraceae bacterium]